MRPAVWVAFLAYWALLAVVGWKAPRRKGLSGYFLGGRGLGAPAVAMSLTVGWFGATSILVSVGEARRAGLSAAWLIGIPTVATLLVFSAFLVRRIHALPSLTLPELMERGYGRTVGRAAAVLVVWYMTVLAASQLTAAGGLIASTLSVPRFAALAAAAGFVLAYSLSGGFAAIVRTHAVQFAVLAAGLGGLLLEMARRTSPRDVVAAARSLPAPGYLDPFAGFGTNAWIFVSFLLAWTISPIAWQRIQAARSPRSARAGTLGAAGLLLLLYAAVVGIGMLALTAVRGDIPAESLVPWLIAESAGRVLGPLLFVAALAAILSTLDTAANAGAFSLARDVFEPLMPPARSPRGTVLAPRVAMVMVVAAALAVSLRFESILLTLGLSSEIMAEAFFVPGMAYLLGGRRRPAAGALAMALGGGFSLAGFAARAGLLPMTLPSWPRSVPYGVGLSLAGFLAGSLVDRAARLHSAARFRYDGAPMSKLRNLRWALVGVAGRSLLRAIAWSSRIRVAGEDEYRRLRAAGRPVVLLIWHGRILMAPYFFRGRGIMPLVSPSEDGEIIARITGRWGYKPLRGSSSHSVMGAWEAMLRELRAGGEVIIVPDGPRGPDRVLKAGCVRLARETGAALVPVSFSASRGKVLRTWDRFLVVRPFSRVLAAYGEPLFVGRDVGRDRLEGERRRVEEACLALERETDAAAARPRPVAAPET